MHTIDGYYLYTDYNKDPDNPHDGGRVRVVAYDPEDDIYDCVSPFGDVYAREDELSPVPDPEFDKVYIYRQREPKDPDFPGEGEPVIWTGESAETTIGAEGTVFTMQAVELDESGDPVGTLEAYADELYPVPVYEVGQLVRFKPGVIVAFRYQPQGEFLIKRVIKPGDMDSWKESGQEWFNMNELYEIEWVPGESDLFYAWQLEPVNTPEGGSTAIVQLDKTLIPEFGLGQWVKVVDPADHRFGWTGHVTAYGRSENAPGIEAHLKYAVEFDDKPLDWDYYRGSQLKPAAVGDVLNDPRVAPEADPYDPGVLRAADFPSHVELFLLFCKEAAASGSLHVREIQDNYHHWFVMSQAPHHQQLIHVRFIKDNGNFDYFSIQYDDSKLRTVPYGEAYPNILAEAAAPY